MKKTLTEIKPFQNPELVVLRNPVAKARFGLSLVQQKFLFEVLAFFKSQPEQRIARFNIREYFGKLGIQTNNLGEYVKEVEEMRRLDVKIPTGDNEKGINFIGVTLFASVEYRVGPDRTGYIEVEVSDKLKPYFLEIAKGDFFSYHILNTRVLKSTHSIKLYLLLKSYARFGALELPLEELKDILEVDPAAYKQYPDFRKRVLERARTEMLEKNDICFEYEEVRQNPRSSKSPVVRIVFRIFDNPQKRQIRERNEARLAVRRGAPKAVKNREMPLKTAEKLDERAGQELSANRAELVELFRKFDAEHDETFILRYVESLGHDEEAVLDGLHYAFKQGSVKNIYAYLPTVLRAEAGRGMAASARSEREKKRRFEAERRQMEALKKEREAVLDDIEAVRRDIVRQIVADDPTATERIIGLVKERFRGAFGVNDELSIDVFRENPLLRSLVMNEFRQVFQSLFLQSTALGALESRADELKKLLSAR